MTTSDSSSSSAAQPTETAGAPVARRLPVGAEPGPDGTHFRIFASSRDRVAVAIEDGSGAPGVHPLEPEGDGWYSGLVAAARPGTRYRYELDGADRFPDPAARWSPDGPHEASAVEDASTFGWTDTAWRGPTRHGQVFYELHIGAFTPEGTWAAAAEQLLYLRDLGVTAIEVMPVAEFPGEFGWGYDGVQLFAPYHGYGTPDDMRRFVDRAHALGLAVILDVVYNHFGPDANYLGQYTDVFASKTHHTDWGTAINYDGPDSAPVRAFVLANVEHWIRDYHLDGLRLDATQDIYDDSDEHLVAAIVRVAREAAGERQVLIIAENEPQDARIVRPREEGGYGADMMWNDDYHHSALVAMTGRREAYLMDYDGSARELSTSIRYGFLYQGQWYAWQGKHRGVPAYDLAAEQFVNFLENHDQVSNLARGERVHRLTSQGRWRATTALTLLGPATPLLFMGQEFAASSRFLFFADHKPDLARLVHEGRREFLSQFPTVKAEFLPFVEDPAARSTYDSSRIDLAERERNVHALDLHRDLLRLRRDEPALSQARRVESGAISDRVLYVRWLHGGEDDRLLVVNLGASRHLTAPSDPLLAPPPGTRWAVRWSSEHPRYGGLGTAPLHREHDGLWTLSPECALLLHPQSFDADRDAPPESR